MPTFVEFVKLLSKTTLSDKQQELLQYLYNTPNGLTIRTLTDLMFDDDDRMHIAGVLADLSKRLVPGVSHNAYQLYLDTDHVDGVEERLSLKPELRKAIDVMVNRPF